MKTTFPKLNNLFFALLIAILSSLNGFAIAQDQVVDGIAAIVGDEIILRSDVDQIAQSQAVRLRIDPNRNPSRYESLWNQSLESMIDQKILLDRAELDSIEVSDREVEDALETQVDQIIQRFGTQEKAEEAIGFSMSRLKRNYREDIKKRLLVERVQQQKFTDVTASRREVEEFFHEYQDSLPEIKESVNISHILIELKPSETSDNIAREKADSILTLIKNGADFDELAKEYSHDTNSAVNGGDLGFVKRGTLVIEFEEMAFSMEPGEVSPLVKTEFGYHIIKLVERRGERINSKHILIMPVSTSNDEADLIEKLNSFRQRILDGEKFEDLAYEYSEDPEAQYNKGNLGWFEIESMSIPEFSAVIDTLPVGKISIPFKTNFGYHIIQNHERKEAGKLNLKDNWSEIQGLVIRNKRVKVYNEWLESIRKDVFIEIKM